MKSSSSLFRLLQKAILLFVLTLFTGCGGSAPGTGVSAGTGAITAKLVWQESAQSQAVKAAAASGVATVRVIVSGADMTTMQQEFNAAAGSGVISGVPVGANRTVTFQGVSASGGITHQAVTSGVTVSSGPATDLGTVTMLVSVAPAAPTGLAATVNSTSRIDLAWSDSDQLETGFTIERKTGAGGSWVQVATVAANTTSYSNVGLNPSTGYYYRVKATNSVGDSAWSGEANATTNSPAIQLAKTGQTTSYAAGDDGALKKGAAWPNPRFTDNADGTVTDNLTGLIWLKNANCFGTKNWADALTAANSLASGACGLTDGSTASQWRLPNIVELESLFDLGRYNPALTLGHPFSNVQSSNNTQFSNSYWSSSSSAGNAANAWSVAMYEGAMIGILGPKSYAIHVWPVRAVSSTLPKTGQTTCYNSTGAVIACAGTGQDGELQKGVVWPATRFTDNSNGTVSDNLTGLVWLKNANCTDTVGSIAKTANSGKLAWANAVTWSNNLASGACGLSDGSAVGQWRLPNRKELQSLIDRSRVNPVLPQGHPFSNMPLQISDNYIFYWSSSSYAGNATDAWVVSMSADGTAFAPKDDLEHVFVWPVRGGQ